MSEPKREPIARWLASELRRRAELESWEPSAAGGGERDQPDAEFSGGLGSSAWRVALTDQTDGAGASLRMACELRDGKYRVNVPLGPLEATHLAAELLSFALFAEGEAAADLFASEVHRKANALNDSAVEVFEDLAVAMARAYAYAVEALPAGEDD